MRLSVQKGGRYLAALMVALMLLWSLSLVLPGRADATTGQETSAETQSYKGDGGKCWPGHDGKTGGKGDCDPVDDCPVQVQGGSHHDDCEPDDDCPVQVQGGSHYDDDCEPDDDCPVQVQGGKDGHHDDDDCDPGTTTSTTTSTTSTSTTTTTVGGTTDTPLDIAAAGAECRNEIPYLAYDIDWPAGGTATITFINPVGADVVYPNVPLTGAVLWPGASENPPDWPGWVLENGKWVEADDGFLWARGTVQVQFEVNPTAVVTVSYPTSSAICAGPQNIPDVVGGVTITPPPPPGDDVGGVTVLPFTGIDAGAIAAIAFAALALGSLVLVSSRREDVGES